MNERAQENQNNKRTITYNNPSLNVYKPGPTDYYFFNTVSPTNSSALRQNLLNKSSPTNPFSSIRTFKTQLSETKTNETNSPNIEPSESTEYLNAVCYKLVGLVNLGNTCYMNSAIQILLHCPIFIKNLLKSMGRRLISLLDRKETTSHHFLRLLFEFNKEDDFNSLDISFFKEAFGMKHQQFVGLQQHDSMEFLRTLLEDLNKELNRIFSKPKYKQIDLMSSLNGKSNLMKFNEVKCILNREFHKQYRSRESSIIIDLFYGQLCRTFTCENCKKASYSFEKIMELPLALNNHDLLALSLTNNNNNNNGVNDNDNTVNEIFHNQQQNVIVLPSPKPLMNLIKEYFSDETIEKNCEKCSVKTNHYSKVSFSMLPPVLCLNILRVDLLTGEKNDKEISFPELLDLNDLVDLDCINFKENIKDSLNSSSNSTIYQLRGLINHYGRMNFGHYLDYININGKWFEFNDSIVSEINEEDALRSSGAVYSLFYERVF